jgi:TonB family protein
MRKLLILSLLLVGFATEATAACNLDGAVQLQANLAQLGRWTESGDSVEVTWTDFVSEQSADQKRRLIEAFANTDACIKGRAREIKFFGRGVLMGVASPSTGISLIDPPTPSRKKATPDKQAALTVRGKAIYVGMPADDVFAILKPLEMIDQEVKGDTKFAGSLRVTKRFRADSQAFTLVMARTTPDGPYLVSSIALQARTGSGIGTANAAGHARGEVSKDENRRTPSKTVRAASTVTAKVPAEPAIGMATQDETLPARLPVTQGGTIDMGNCKPEYPSHSKFNEETGTVTLWFVVSPAGQVIGTTVHASTGFRDLDMAARNALSKCTFHPALVDGKPVETRIEVRYSFSLDD